LINDILDYSKIEANKINIESVEFELSHLLNETVASFAPSVADKSVELILECSGIEESWVIADPGRIRQVLNNLLSNAIKFTDRGEVVLRVWFRAINEERTLLEFSVRDTGIGILQDQQELLFEKFTQADSSTTRQYEGKGLGLSIIKCLCELMGGSVALKSELGVGSEFSGQLVL